MDNRGATLRSAGPADADFLYAVYASTRADEMALVDWSDSQKETFLRMQFDAQHRFYVENYPGARFQIIQLGDDLVGRLYIHRTEADIRIMDISLLPQFRNHGIGSALLSQILDTAQNNNLTVTIHVEQFNPARRLYERLGFSFVEANGIYHLMEWKPAGKLSPQHA